MMAAHAIQLVNINESDKVDQTSISSIQSLEIKRFFSFFYEIKIRKVSRFQMVIGEGN